MVDIRLTLLILLGSLLGVQLGAIGTTYVKEYVIKIVMGTIMLIVAVSRGLAIPTYLRDLELLAFSDSIAGLLRKGSFAFMCLALAVGAVIIIGAMVRARVMAPETGAEGLEPVRMLQE